MKKNISRNPLWPDWYNGKKIDEVQFGRAFLEQWPLKCVKIGRASCRERV